MSAPEQNTNCTSNFACGLFDLKLTNIFIFVLFLFSLYFGELCLLKGKPTFFIFVFKQPLFGKAMTQSLKESYS
jgi:ABC-type protease/lipase transport system fused ATPase/permease subunit